MTINTKLQTTKSTYLVFLVFSFVLLSSDKLSRLAHGTPFRCAWEDGILDNSKVVQVAT